MTKPATPTAKPRSQKRDATEALGDDAAAVRAKMPAITAQAPPPTDSELGVLPPP